MNNKQELDNFMNDFPAEITDENVLLFFSVCPLGAKVGMALSLTYLIGRAEGLSADNCFEEVMRVFIETNNERNMQEHAQDN